jgi:hypothetical protein
LPFSLSNRVHDHNLEVIFCERGGRIDTMRSVVVSVVRLTYSSHASHCRWCLIEHHGPIDKAAIRGEQKQASDYYYAHLSHSAMRVVIQSSLWYFCISLLASSPFVTTLLFPPLRPPRPIATTRARFLLASSDNEAAMQDFINTKAPSWLKSMDALPFACTECGKCCRLKDGCVYRE